MMDQVVKTNSKPFTGNFGEDIEIAKRLIAAHPTVDLSRLMAIAADPQQPESARVASVYVLGFTDDGGVSKTILSRLASDPNPEVKDHAAEALASITAATSSSRP